MRNKLIESGQIVQKGYFKGRAFKFSECECYFSDGVIERDIRDFGIRDGEIGRGSIRVFKKGVKYPCKEILKTFSRVYVHGEFFTVEAD